MHGTRLRGLVKWCRVNCRLWGDVSLAVTFLAPHDGWPKSGCLIASSELVFVASATPLAHCAKVVGWLSELSDTPAWVTTHVLAIIQRGRVSLFSLFTLFTLYFLRLVFSLSFASFSPFILLHFFFILHPQIHSFETLSAAGALSLTHKLIRLKRTVARLKLWKTIRHNVQSHCCWVFFLLLLLCLVVCALFIQPVITTAVVWCAWHFGSESLSFLFSLRICSVPLAALKLISSPFRTWSSAPL